jgi:hypothetical protein
MLGCEIQTQLRFCEQILLEASHHHGIPLISSRVATQERNAHALFEEHILTVAELIAELDLMALEVVDVLEFPRSVSKYRRQRKVAVVYVWREDSKRYKQLCYASVISC